jgi:hypothetical protein
MTIHLVGCCWYYICRQDKFWIPPLDFVYTESYPKIYRTWSEDYSDVFRYLVNLYNAILFLGGNEMGPRSTTEIATSTFILMALAIFNASLFGDMAVLTEMRGRQAASFQE